MPSQRFFGFSLGHHLRLFDPFAPAATGTVDKDPSELDYCRTTEERASNSLTQGSNVRCYSQHRQGHHKAEAEAEDGLPRI